MIPRCVLKRRPGLLGLDSLGFKRAGILEAAGAFVEYQSRPKLPVNEFVWRDRQ
jgi:hypothetical protein